jgi:vacuolar-type H+-ATPase subunit I/STV1
MNLTTKSTMAATVLLLIAALVLSLRNHTELKEERIKNENLTAQLNQQGPSDFQAQPVLGDEIERRLAAVERIAQTKASENAMLKQELEASKIAKEESSVLNDLVDKTIKESEEELSPLQQKIKDAVALAEVAGVNDEWGFVTINAGTNQMVEPGIVFAVRRGNYIVGRVKVASAENDSAIANIEPNSMAPGFRIEAGDSVISYPIF